MNDKRFNIRMPEELFNEIEQKAKDMNITSSALIKIAVTEYLKKNK